MMDSSSVMRKNHENLRKVEHVVFYTARWGTANADSYVEEKACKYVGCLQFTLDINTLYN